MESTLAVLIALGIVVAVIAVARRKRRPSGGGGNPAKSDEGKINEN